MADWLKQKKSKPPENRKNIIGIHGVEGSGKTSFAAQFPGALFLFSTGETGLLTLMSAGQIKSAEYLPEMTNWLDTLEVLQQVSDSAEPPKTIVLDTISGFSELCNEFVCQRSFEGKMERFYAYGNGPDAAVVDWRMLLSLLDKIRNNGTNVLLLSHTATPPFKNPEGHDYNRYAGKMDKPTWAVTKEFCDMVMFINFYTLVDKETTGSVTAKGGTNRIYHFGHGAAWDAKNRHGLPSSMQSKGSAAKDFEEFQTLVMAGRKQDK